MISSWRGSKGFRTERYQRDGECTVLILKFEVGAFVTVTSRSYVQNTFTKKHVTINGRCTPPHVPESKYTLRVEAPVRRVALPLSIQ